MSCKSNEKNNSASCSRTSDVNLGCASSSNIVFPPRLNSAQGSVPLLLPMPRGNTATNPPPVPPRPMTMPFNQLRGGLPYNSYMPYSRYPMTPGYSSYNTYGNMGFGPPRYGFSHGYPQSTAELSDAESAFFRMAEESSRGAFQSIETLVTAVGSISMMLESTYHAVYSSFRAILGVVESFSRLRNHLAHVVSTLALLRTFHWLLQRFLYFLGLRRTHPSAEAAWSAASSAIANSTVGGPAPHSTWPFIMFLSIVFGAPWLIFRIFSKLAVKKQIEGTMPQPEEAPGHAVVLYDFRAVQKGDLSVRAGQRVTVLPKSQQPKIKGWCAVLSEDNMTGMVPIDYIRLYRKKLLAQPSVKLPKSEDQPEPQPPESVDKKSDC